MARVKVKEYLITELRIAVGLLDWKDAAENGQKKEAKPGSLASRMLLRRLVRRLLLVRRRRDRDRLRPIRRATM